MDAMADSIATLLLREAARNARHPWRHGDICSGRLAGEAAGEGVRCYSRILRRVSCYSRILHGLLDGLEACLKGSEGRKTATDFEGLVG